MRVEATSVGQYNRIRVEPLTGAIGAEVAEVDLRLVDEEILAELKDAWLAHKVLFFRDQDLTHDQHVAYGRALGELEIHPFIADATGHPEIIVLESTPEKFNAAEAWHSDVTFRECPPLGSVLVGRTIPPWGGDTCWANMELAYERLPDEVREQIDNRVAIHSYVKAFGRTMTSEQRAKAEEDFPAQKHPVVRTHPVTGRRCLFLNRAFTVGIDGMDRDESDELCRQLYTAVVNPEIQCRFRWRAGSVAQWDNRCTQHYAVPDYVGFHRRVERVTIIGDRPV
jgi:taurine dioxygenase